MDAPFPRPSVPAIARRMLCLNLLQYRLAAELAYVEAPDAETREGAADSVADLQDHLMDTGLWEAVVPSERKLFATAPGSWTEEDFAMAAWRREALGTLFWAVNLLPSIPTYDTPFDDLGGVVDPDQWEFALEEAFLVPDDDLIRAKYTASAYYWRTTVGKPPFTESNNPELIALRAQEHAEAGLIPPTIERDFQAFGIPFHMLDEERVGYVQAISIERFFAIRWILGEVQWT